MVEEIRFTYQFDWDQVKARSNLADHKVSFQLATTVFRDVFALTVHDEEHSEDEERWVTLGQAENKQYLVVIHTFEQPGPTEARIRLISARPAIKREIQDYENTPR